MGDLNDISTNQTGSLGTSDSAKAGIGRLFRPPVFDDEEKSRAAAALHTILLVLFGITCLAYLSLLVAAPPIRIITISSLLAVELLSYILLRRGRVREAALFLVTVAWILLVNALTLTGGVGATSNSVLTLVVISAGLLLGGFTGLIFAALSTLAGLVLLILELNGLLPPSLTTAEPASYWVFVSLTFFGSAGLISITSRSLRQALDRAQKNEEAQAEANLQLQAIRASLEEAIEERTRSLEQRSRYLQASVDVSHAAASILDSDLLIQQSVDLIRQQFDLYYVGLFLLDLDGEWAILRAGTGEAGRAMLSRGHRIRVGTGMIGWCIANAQPRVALEAGEDAVRLATPDLPETRSEAAIPLRSRGRILGAITVQSERMNGLGEIESTTFQALADQIAVAIDNANLFQESQLALAEMQRAYGEAGQKSWQEWMRSGVALAYRYEHGQVMPLEGGRTEFGESDRDRRALVRETIQQADKLLLPISVREQVVGLLKLQKPEGEGTWSEEEIALLRTLGDQLGVALDSARLYQDAQRLAIRERITAQATGNIRQTLDIETILRTAIQQVQENLGAPEVVISLGLPATQTEEADSG